MAVERSGSIQRKFSRDGVAASARQQTHIRAVAKESRSEIKRVKPTMNRNRDFHADSLRNTGANCAS